MTKGRWWIGVTAGVAVGLGAVVATEAATDTATAQTARQAGFTLSVEQLRINQRISQAAVRRSNESLDLLEPIRPVQRQPDKVLGWRTRDLRDGAVTKAKLETSVREGQPRWAVVEAGSGALARGKGVTTSAPLPGPGEYSVTFDRDVSACSVQATIASSGTTAPPTSGEVVAWRSPDNANVVLVRTATPAGAPIGTLPFHVAVLC
ncbi:MAG: hypothetical protein K2X91_09865 [Thermoleophilia bacterium]|nr:hypothetical protein [Thermoleophilia bacterium]